ncbi:Na/Pi cotransporter family protein [Rhodovulum marinum]|uniref:Phosphate:Na+ symporter n=1 Tax=Rhodovulum marinum TaxID=320662 RepID=A0A4R2Q2E7_9RHOB|nr:Na/Pi cotransporter family protein [Rhodovulum marinum]TCP40791.1 phosphate:Na+ symporter [Rhodovulum marinum]
MGDIETLGTLSTTLVGGLALFLFGMEIMTRALKQVAGASMKMMLARMTGNRFAGLVAGAVVTALIQSSSVTTVLLVGFISAGLMTTAQSVAVIFGANIGTTITAQILAFDVDALALPLLSIGFFGAFLARRSRFAEIGRIVLGLGLIFFGMATMKAAMEPLRDVPAFVDFLAALDNVALAALAGAAITGIMQASAVTAGLAIVLTAQGLIDLDTAIAIALGANIGTCVTALLASIGQPREAVRAAMVHVIFNVVGVLLWIGFIDQLALLAKVAVPEGASTPRHLANAHTIFNVLNAFAFLGFTTQITRFVEWLLPDRPERIEPRFAPRHLDAKFLEVSAIALDAARLEIGHLCELVRSLLDAAVPAVVTGSPLEIDRLRVMDRPVDLLHREIVSYLRQVSLGSLPEGQSARMMALIRVANDLEHIGDLVATGLVTSARKRNEENVVISPQTAAMIARLHREVIRAFDGIANAMDAQDAGPAKAVREMKAGFTQLLEEAAAHEVARLRADAPRRLHTYTREIELTETFEDIFKILRRIARTEMEIFTTRPEQPQSDTTGHQAAE